MLINVYRSHIRFIWGWGGGRVPMNSLPLRGGGGVEETVSHRQNDDVKEVGTPPVRSNLRTPLTAVSTSCAEQSHGDSVREATAEEQMKQRTVQHSVRTQLHLPPLHLSLDSILYYIGMSRYTCFCSIRPHACLHTVKYPLFPLGVSTPL